jgi:hypothetical protein
MIASFSELKNINTETSDAQTSITDLQNHASDDAGEIKSKLDDVISAVDANQ